MKKAQHSTAILSMGVAIRQELGAFIQCDDTLNLIESYRLCKAAIRAARRSDHRLSLLTAKALIEDAAECIVDGGTGKRSVMAAIEALTIL